VSILYGGDFLVSKERIFIQINYKI
jgi:hypothetical protein